MEKLTEDILNKKTEAIKDWLLEAVSYTHLDVYKRQEESVR